MALNLPETFAGSRTGGPLFVCLLFFLIVQGLIAWDTLPLAKVEDSGIKPVLLEFSESLRKGTLEHFSPLFTRRRQYVLNDLFPRRRLSWQAFTLPHRDSEPGDLRPDLQRAVVSFLTSGWAEIEVPVMNREGVCLLFFLLKRDTVWKIDDIRVRRLTPMKTEPLVLRSPDFFMEIRVGQTFLHRFSVEGGKRPLRFSLRNNPPWLSINPSSGLLRGTPPQTGSFSCLVEVADALGQTVREGFEFPVQENPFPEGWGHPCLVDPSEFDPEESVWDDYGPKYEGTTMTSEGGGYYSHAYGSNKGRFVYHFTLRDLEKPGPGRISACLSAEDPSYLLKNSGETDKPWRAQSARPRGMSHANSLRVAKGGACPPLLRSYDPPSRKQGGIGGTEVRLDVNGKSAGNRKVRADDGAGEIYFWQVPGEFFKAGKNSLAFVVEGEAANGLCIYHRPIMQGFPLRQIVIHPRIGVK